MSLIIKYLETAKDEIDVDLARFNYDEKTLFVEFAKIISENEENGELEELEVRLKMKLPIETALVNFVSYLRTLVDHENEFKSGYGLTIPESKKDE